ncbi:MAG: N-acetylneuraminate synthase family protein [Nitrospinaceae bacterium]|jgi:sialic acid synthase SpsE|nr:N-acetylneuraminate synthase family protein [Nitrospinaceae bacterium]|tara:strand:+ start:12427 stop:13128 length:702 start_codon:yes stop_codon:yes gene_type:complete
MEIIADIGQNHNGDVEIALELIRAAKENGADVAKFQLYDAKALFPKTGNEWYDYNCRTEISRKQLERLVEECRRVDIEFMASVFDGQRIEWLEAVNVSRYKVASRSINDRELIRAIGRTGKPMIVSLGMWKGSELPEINTSASVHFLHCISHYPPQFEELKLSQVDFDEIISGLSDHTIGITAALVAFSRGAEIVEKHFTLDKEMVGPDHCCSMTPDELNTLNRYKVEIARCL